MKPRLDNPSPELLRTLFRYDPLSGFLFWLIDPPFKKVKDQRAGCVGAGGYRQIRFGGVTYKETRIIWAMQTGSWPANWIDHKNGNRSDNRWENLREATPTQNRQNAVGKNPGLKGVSVASGKYRARIKIAGQTRHLGTYVTAAEAAAAYGDEAVRVYGEYARK